MTLDELRNEVSNDITMDKTELDIEAIKTPQLHGKYLNFLIDEKLILTKYENDFNRLRKMKWLFYTGKISQEQLKDLEWEPFELSVLKQDIDKFMDSDDDLIMFKNKIAYQKEKINYLDQTLKMISNRQWLIREAIDWVKFTNGV
tara:strand:+ start:82 stop:516 length:435 start_codon:yes stop_codon:yes gene_type:complete